MKIPGTLRAGDRYRRLLEAGVGDERFVRDALSMLEHDFREMALAALAGWDRLGIASPDLFHAAASLQRPSWGTWNGLIVALRRARRAAVAAAGAAERARIGGAEALARVVDLFDEPVDPETAESLESLREFLDVERRRRLTVGAVFSLPITLRNRIAHGAPTDPSWWASAAAALRPLVAFHAQRSPCTTAAAGAPRSAPWFEEKDGELWSFGGIDSGTVVYLSCGSMRTAREPLAAVLLAIQRLIGRTELEEAEFRDLLGRLAPEEVRGVILGDVLVGRPVGRGGFATVHVGRQLSTGRKVAVKVLRDGMDADDRTRFAQEAEYLARLNHPHVVQVLDYDEAPWLAPRNVDLSGEAWFQEFRRAPRKQFIALEWLDGGSLDELYVAVRDGTRPPPARRRLAEWFRDAAAALAAVHAQGLVHRDVKPSNLMLDDQGAVKLLDFGVARTLAEDRTLRTATGGIVGTPAYMSPEQIEADRAANDVGPASDVYSLCATFYELFTERRLYNHDSRAADDVTTSKRTGAPPQAPRSIVRDLPWEVETILLGGLQTEPSLRYRTMDALRRDIRHFLADEPIEYRRPSSWRRARLAYRRNGSVANVVSAAALAAVIGTGFYIHRVDEERRRTADERDQKDRALTQVTAQKAIAETERREAELRLADSLVAQGSTLIDQERAGEARALLADSFEIYRRYDASPLAAAAEYVRARSISPEPLMICRAGLENGDCAAVSPSGAEIVVGRADGTLTRWDLVTGRGIGPLPAHESPVRFCAYLPGGERVVSLGEDLLLRVSRLDGTALSTVELHRAGPLMGACLSGDGRTLFTLSNEGGVGAVHERDGNDREERGVVDVVDLATGRSLRTIRVPRRWYCVAADEPGRRLLLSGVDQAVLVDTDSPERLEILCDGEGHPLMDWSAVIAVAIDASGQIGACAYGDGIVEVWNLGTLEKTWSGQVDPTGVTAISMSSDAFASELACGGASGRIRVLGDGDRSLVQHVGRVGLLAFAGSSRQLVSAAADGAVCRWPSELDAAQESSFEIGAFFLHKLRFSPGGRLLLGCDIDGTAFVADAESGTLLLRREFEAPAVDAAFDARGGLLALCEDGVIRTVSMVDDSAGTWRAHEASGAALAIAPDSGRIVTSGGPPGGRQIRVWDLRPASPVLLSQLPVEEGDDDRLAISAGGTRIAATGTNRRVALWECDSDRPRWSMDAGVLVEQLAFSPDEKLLALAQYGGVVRLLDTATGAVVRGMRGHLNDVTGVAFSPDGRVLVSSSCDGTVRYWRTRDGRELAKTTIGPQAVSLALADTGRWAVGTRGDQDLYGRVDFKVWDLARVAAYVDGARRLEAGTLGDDPVGLTRWYDVRGEAALATACSAGRQLAGDLDDAMRAESIRDWDSALTTYERLRRDARDTWDRAFASLKVQALTVSPLALFAAAGKGVFDHDLITFLLAHGADVHATNDEGDTALHIAASATGDAEEVVSQLLAHSASVDAVGFRAETPLHRACVSGHEGVVRRLLAAGADPTRADRDGQTALHRASWQGSAAVVAVLLAAGAGPDSPDSSGRSPLHHAAERANVEVVEALLARGASRDLVDAEGRTPADAAGDPDDFSERGPRESSLLRRANEALGGGTAISEERRARVRELLRGGESR